MRPEIKKIIKNKLPFIIPPIKFAVAIIRQQLSKNHVERLLKERDEIFLELGAGEKKGIGKWVTVDMTKNCDLFWDIRKGIPFPDETVSKVYASHFFEHFTYRETQKILDECIRVLVPDGRISICVPNAKLYIEAYLGLRTLDKNQF